MTNNEALRRAAALCARGEQCTASIREKLERWETPDIDHVLRLLHEGRYIDDTRYARAFVADKLRYNHWGRIKLRAALRMKGIDNATIAEAIDSIDTDEYIEILQQVLHAKARTMHDSNPYTMCQKLARHAASHGFETSLCLEYAKALSGNE